MRITVEIPDDADLTQDISFTIPRNFWSKLYQDFDNAINAIKTKAEEQADEYLNRHEVKVKADFVFDSREHDRNYDRHMAALSEILSRQQSQALEMRGMNSYQGQLTNSFSAGLAAQQAAGNEIALVCLSGSNPYNSLHY